MPEALVTGWSQGLASLTAWASRELIVFGSAVSLVIFLVLGVVYRDARLWLLHTLSLIAAAAGTIATLKIIHVPINLLNVLAFPLMLGVGVDYGTHIILAAKEQGDALRNISDVLKPIALSGLTTATGFGALILAQNAGSLGSRHYLRHRRVLVPPGIAVDCNSRDGDSWSKATTAVFLIRSRLSATCTATKARLETPS